MRRIPASIAWWLLLLGGLQAAPENRVVLEITGTAEHPRNSEGSFATLRSGRIIFCYSQFDGGNSDFSPSQVAEVHSDDRGVTWSAPRVIVGNGPNFNVMSVSLLRLADGKLALFYAEKRGYLSCHPYLRISTDEGLTWSAPQLVVPGPGYFVINNDRVIQTGPGRIIVPVAFHRLLATGENEHNISHNGLVLWYLSDDDGSTWREARSCWALPVASDNGLQEPGIVELPDGSLFSWARTDQGRQYGFRSRDGGVTWTAPEPTGLMSPCSPASIKRLPDSDALLAVYNDRSGRFPFPPTAKWYLGRTPLVTAISRDGARTWSTPRLLESETNGNFCYCAIHFVDDAVLLAYAYYVIPDPLPAAGRPRIFTLRLRRIDRAWLLGETN